MNLLFEINAEADFESYKKFFKTISNKVHHFNYYRFGFTLGFFVLSITSKNNMGMTMLYLICAILFPIFLTINRIYSIRKTWTYGKEFGMHKTKYLFYEDHMEQHNKLGSSNFEYSKFYKIIETKDAFYFLVTRNISYLINKKDCSEELCSFLQEVRNLNLIKKDI